MAWLSEAGWIYANGGIFSTKTTKEASTYDFLVSTTRFYPSCDSAKMSDLVGFEVPKMDWTPGPDLVARFKRFRQKCELLLDRPLKAETALRSANMCYCGQEVMDWIYLTRGH